MKIACIQHVNFEKPGFISDWAIENRHEIKIYHPYLDGIFPTIDDFDALIILGGPMSANDEDTIAWLKMEKQLIWKTYTNKKKIIGICLGAQLIAASFGEKVYKNKTKEIGWFDVKTIYTSKLPFPDTFTPFHWHGETFDLPQNGALLIQSENCQNQVFLIGENVLGIQFHLEMGENEILAILENGGSELTNDPNIQSKENILSQFELIKSNKIILNNILNSFFN
ncbi:MAG: type 1 glutamine amidotransferase [Bacteroidetes bacterium]|nr:type 1 glutamine amidotransferase [Bacteroidota bacterium]